MNDNIRQIDGFYINSIYYTDTDSLYVHKKQWSTLVDKGFVGKSLEQDKNDYGNSRKFLCLVFGTRDQVLLSD